MTERQYLIDIKRKCKALEVWRDEFERTQRRLAKIYVRIDDVEKLFVETGGAYVVMHSNNKGSKNAARNPYIQELDLLYEQALTYERELGLTVAALKKINESALKAKSESPMAEVFRQMAKGGQAG